MWILIVVFCFGIPVYGLVLVALHVTADNPQEMKKRRLPDVGVIVSISIMAICIIVFTVRNACVCVCVRTFCIMLLIFSINHKNYLGYKMDCRVLTYFHMSNMCFG